MNGFQTYDQYKDERTYEMIGECVYIKTGDYQTVYIDQSIDGELNISVWNDDNSDSVLHDVSIPTDC